VSWLPRFPSATEEVRSDQDAILSGRVLKPGSKTWLRSLLLSSGWDVEAVDPVVLRQWMVRERISDFEADVRKTDPTPPPALLAKLKTHWPVRLAKVTGASASTLSMWDSLGRHPSWLTTRRGFGVAVVGPTHLALQRATANLVFDLWENLGQGPEYRMPVVRRLNLLSWSSADGLSRYAEQAKNHDLTIVYGGIGRDDTIHHEMGYLNALIQASKGLVVFETLPGADPFQLTSLLKNAGCQHRFSIGAKHNGT
jgi:hypothetical protein